MSFNWNQGGPFGRGAGGRRSQGMFNPFGQTRQGGWVNPAMQGAISVPEKVMGLTTLAVAAAIGGVVLGYEGLAVSVGSGYFLWFIVMLGLVFGAQALADRPVLGITLFVAFGVVTGVIISPLLIVLQQAGMANVVYEALAGTAAVTGAVTVYARRTSRDFSRLLGWLFAALIWIIVAMVIGLFVHSTALEILISAAACVVFSGFLLYDVQRVAMTRVTTQGNAIRLALSVYLDIFNLFLNLLMLLALTQGGGGSRR